MGLIEKLTARYERLPSWIQEAHSIKGLAEAVRNAEVKAAYYPAPPHQNLSDFRTVIRHSVLPKDISWSSDEESHPAEIVDVFIKHTEGIKRHWHDSLELISAGVATLHAIFADLEAIQKAFPDYSLGHFVIRRRSSAEEQEPLGHQDHSVSPDKEVLVVLRTYFGLSTEYSDTKVGTKKVVPPSQSIAVHKGIDSHKEEDPDFPFHWIPEIGKEGRLSVLAILTKEKH